jgi:hypothetical protein
MTAKQRKVHGFALITGFCGVVIAVAGVGGVVMIFGHVIMPVLVGMLHLTLTEVACSAGLLGLLTGLKLGYKEAKGRFCD